MRINPEQIKTITEITHKVAGDDAQVWLYGSRLQDERKGGDIDLMIQTLTPLSLLDRAKIKVRIESLLDIPVDVLNTTLDSTRPFVEIARAHAVRLD
jgi:predicted nucleotidyltransferase